MKLNTGIEKLNEILGGGIDDKSSVLLLASPLVDKSSFAQHIFSTRISEEDKGIYLTTSKIPEQIEKNLEEHGWETKNIKYVDCISSTLGKEQKTKYFLKEKLIDGTNILPKISELWDKAIKETKGFKIDIFDSLESIMGYRIDETVDFINNLKKSHGGSTAFFLLTDWGYEKEKIEKIKTCFDLVIELGSVEKKYLWMDYFFVGASPKIFFWITLTGVNLYIPKILVTGPYHAGKSTTVKNLSEGSISVDRVSTTVALDHGYIERKGIICDIFGTPGQERFDWILKVLSKDIWGIILVIDSTAPETFGRAKEMLKKVEGEKLLFVVFANKQNIPNHLEIEEIKKRIGYADILPVNALESESLEKGFKVLINKIFKV